MLQNPATRRGFMGAMATALSYVGFSTPFKLFAQARQARQGEGAGAAAAELAPLTPEEYDRMAKLANNENGWGASDTVTKAMTDALKYGNRYRYPDGGIVEAIE